MVVVVWGGFWGRHSQYPFPSFPCLLSQPWPSLPEQLRFAFQLEHVLRPSPSLDYQPWLMFFQEVSFWPHIPESCNSRTGMRTPILPPHTLRTSCILACRAGSTISLKVRCHLPSLRLCLLRCRLNHFNPLGFRNSNQGPTLFLIRYDRSNLLWKLSNRIGSTTR